MPSSVVLVPVSRYGSAILYQMVGTARKSTYVDRWVTMVGWQRPSARLAPYVPAHAGATKSAATR